MKIFQCGHCTQAIYFENHVCQHCGHLSGFRDTDRKMLTFKPDQPQLVSDREHITYKYCKNKEYDVCNWLLEHHNPNDYCNACQLNRIIPNLADAENFEKWQHLEVAKHRLVYQLQKIGLTLTSKLVDDDGLCFDFVTQQYNINLMTGHAHGVITILVKEADSVVREKTRKELSEPYRTVIGHLRHEVGHYFWDRLIATDAVILEQFRVLFGDERVDYSEALQTYYTNGAPTKWQDSYISAYATSHAWEDWAETWAHYLHIMDIVETAYFFGLQVNPVIHMPSMDAVAVKDPYVQPDFNQVIKTCVPLSFAVNSINRAMGIPDVYPFVVTTTVVEKMRFIHELLWKKRG